MDLDDDAGDLMDYPNLSRGIGAVVSSRLATLNELQTVYGGKDLRSFLEVIMVDAANRRAIDKRPPRN